MTRLHPIPYKRRWGDNPTPRPLLWTVAWIAFAFGVFFTLAIVGGSF